MIGNKNMRGQITLEILIALFILVVSISAAIMVSFGSQSITTDSQLNNQALYISRQGLESTRGASRQDFNSLVSSSSTEDIYLKQIIVEDIDAYTKKVTSRISWKTEPLRPQKIELVTLLTNFKAVKDYGGDTGGSGLSGNWKIPRTLGSIDLGPGNSATDLDVLNKIVYLSAEASDVKKPDFFIVNATDGQNPYIVSNLHTGPGLNALDVAGNYAYLANDATDAELQIINIQNISSPMLVSSYEVPGVSGPSRGKTIFYLNQKVYLGLNKVTGQEFHIIDVSNPLSPVLLGSFDVEDNINDIWVNGSRAYLATDLGNAGLMILDVSNPYNIVLLGQAYSTDTNSVFNSNPSRTLLGPAQDFHIADTTEPNNIVNLGSIAVGGDINDIVNRENLAFIATSNSNKEFQIIDISNSTGPTLYSSFNFPQMATGIDYENNTVYVSVRSNDALRIITSSP